MNNLCSEYFPMTDDVIKFLDNINTHINLNRPFRYTFCGEGTLAMYRSLVGNKTFHISTSTH